MRSAQTAPSSDLARILEIHRRQEYRRPFAEHTLRAFCELEQAAAPRQQRLILDIGCGTGESTIALAERFSDCLVIGIDRSELRCSRAVRAVCGAKNAMVVRAEAVDLLRLAQRANWRPWRQYLLYPNPWPKKRHLRRRWHAHPVFPTICALGGRIELRTNWKLYAQEFEIALDLLGRPARLERLEIETPLSAFERKYDASGHMLFSVVAEERPARTAAGF